MEKYIVTGGSYGNMNNQLAVSQVKNRSTTKSIEKRIFLPYDTIKYHYPILQEHKWLLPFYEIRRWCKLVFLSEERKRSIAQLSLNHNMSDDMKNSARNLLEYLEI